MSALLDSLASAFDGNAARRAPLDAALRDGLPHARSEAWKYTSLRALERRSFAPATPAGIDAALVAHVPGPRLVFANGRFDAALSEMTGLPRGASLRPLSGLAAGDESARVAMEGRYDRPDEVFARLNAALADEGAVLRIDDGVALEAPVHLVFVGVAAGSDQAWHTRLLVELGRGARASLVEHHVSLGEHAHLATALVRVHLAATAELLHARVQDESPRASLFARTDAVVAEAAHYRRVDLELGAALARHELNVRLDGEGAGVSANGVLLGTGRRHVDTRLAIEHVARDTTCNLLWRGLGAGRSRVVFHGGITIHAGADGSDANLSNKNLLLSDNAEVDTQPVLEIHADEVKAAHGATVGQLDPTAMFYLRSRGLPGPQARQLLTAAFCREPLAGAGDEALRASLMQALDAALGRVEIA